MALGLHLRGLQSCLQPLFDLLDVAYRTRVRLLRLFARHVGRGNDVNLVTHMIERQQPIEKHQRAVGNIDVFLGDLRAIARIAAPCRKQRNLPRLR